MREVPVYEAKAKLSELLSEVETGSSVTITRRGAPIARLVPAASAAGREGVGQRQEVASIFAALRRARAGVRLDGEAGEAIGDGRD